MRRLQLTRLAGTGYDYRPAREIRLDALSQITMRSSMSARGVLSLLFAVFCATMLGLAAGAVWMVISLYMRHPLPWLALPIGALLAWAIRGSVRHAGTGAMLMAAGATALSAIYVNMLVAGVRIAGNMGMGLIEALRTAGIGMLWRLAGMAATPADVIWTLLAMLLAGWLAHKRLPQPA